MTMRRVQLDPKDKAIVMVMAEWPLEKGQMLLLGPQTCAKINDKDMSPPFPDLHVIDKTEWSRKCGR